MRNMKTAVLALVIAAASIVATVAPGNASAFFGWVVTDVPPGDTLNLRAYPSSQSRILVAYPNGTFLSMTGKCTGGVNLGTIAGWPKWQQRQAIRYVWCETWVDPYGTGQFRPGWVYGKFIRPS